MIIFLYGQDTYRSRHKLNEIVTKYKKTHKNGLNLKSYEGKDLKFEDFRDEVRQTPMFVKRKLIILRNVFSNLSFKENFLKDAKLFVDSEDVVLFYETEEISRTDRFFKFLKKNSKSQEFKLLEGAQLKKWAQKTFEGYRAKIEILGLEKLINYVGNDLWQFSNEIQKLVSFRKGKTITTKDVGLLVKPKIETAIFDTIDAIASRNKKQAISLIHRHLEKGDHPLYLLSMINFQFRNLLTIKDLVERNTPFCLLSKETRLHPYVIKKSYFQAQKFTIDKLKKIYQKILEADLNVKKGKTEPVTALDSLIAEI